MSLLFIVVIIFSLAGIPFWNVWVCITNVYFIFVLTRVPYFIYTHWTSLPAVPQVPETQHCHQNSHFFSTNLLILLFVCFFLSTLWLNIVSWNYFKLFHILHSPWPNWIDSIPEFSLAFLLSFHMTAVLIKVCLFPTNISNIFNLFHLSSFSNLIFTVAKSRWTRVDLGTSCWSFVGSICT